MLRDHRRLRIQLSQFKHGGLFCLALWTAHFVRSQWAQEAFHLERIIEPFVDFIWLWFIIFPGAPLILESQGFYKQPFLRSRRDTAWILARSCALATISLVLVMFPLKLTLARSVIVLFGVTSFVLVYLHEELMRWIYVSRVGRAQLRRKIILVGSPEDTEATRRHLRSGPEEGMDVVATLDLNAQRPEALIDLLHQHSANGVIIQAKHSYLAEIEKAVQVCELEGVETWVVADFFKTAISRKTFDDFRGLPVLVFRTVPDASWQGLGKQMLDFLGGLVLVILFAPLMAVAAVLIKLTSPGPILFRQERCGLNGRPFTMLKFRSMVTDAEQRQHELAILNEMDGPVFKVTNDPRITPVGRFLRKYSIDEFPQLFNVLVGDMSLVGPRPLPVDEVRRFDDIAHRRRLSVKPGLTCLWQISGRNELKNFAEWVRLDLEYIDNWSLWLDLKILCKTVPVVLTGTGAK